MKRLPHRTRETSERIDLGLNLLSLALRPGESIDAEDQAAWCGCSRQAIERIEANALRKLRHTLLFRNRSLGTDLRGALACLAR